MSRVTTDKSDPMDCDSPDNTATTGIFLVSLSMKIPVMIPYVKGFSEQMRRVFGKYGIPTHFKPTNTLRQLLVKPKDPVSKENVVGPVYKIKCEECDVVYIGETERSLKTRFSEHRRPSSTTSEVSKHIHADHPQHSVELGEHWGIDNRAQMVWERSERGHKHQSPSIQASTEMEEGVIYGIRTTTPQTSTPQTSTPRTSTPLGQLPP